MVRVEVYVGTRDAGRTRPWSPSGVTKREPTAADGSRRFITAKTRKTLPTICARSRRGALVREIELHRQRALDGSGVDPSPPCKRDPAKTLRNRRRRLKLPVEGRDGLLNIELSGQRVAGPLAVGARAADLSTKLKVESETARFVPSAEGVARDRIDLPGVLGALRP